MGFAGGFIIGVCATFFCVGIFCLGVAVGKSSNNSGGQK
jgi:hypothetical protein